MTDATASPQAQRPSRTAVLFALAIFLSAALVFLVQPIMGRLLLPMMGGSPSVWNTAMVFFQTALLVGYLYAHLLQRVHGLRTQIAIHLVVLAVSLLAFWPLGLSHLAGPPDTHRPVIWLLVTLIGSVGAPFAALSATAPLLQAWFARVRNGTAEGDNPYVLYAASNIGSFAALIIYPAIIEPTTGLATQTMGWSIGYAVFILAIIGLGGLVWRGDGTALKAPELAATAAISWRQRLTWIGMSAIPASLMLGVTTYLSVDVASAPFLWVIPLALYLVTFVIAFSRRPAIPPAVTLMVQAATAAVCTALMPLTNGEWWMLFALHLSTFFFAALMCHQRLASLRPPPDRLTEFYLWLAFGGVVGGAFNALVAPVLFTSVIEYPLVLCLAALARPWSRTPVRREEWYWFAAIVPLCLVAPLLFWWLSVDARPHQMGLGWDRARMLILFPTAAAAICAFMIRDRARLFCVALCLIALSVSQVVTRYDWTESARSFFGVLRRADVDFHEVGPVRILRHGTTLHGAQVEDGKWRCRPTLYYAPVTPIGETVIVTQNRTAHAVMGVVGEGSGSMAAYTRPGDRMTFFEIDPMVDRWARDPARFTYISECAEGPVRTVIGDARLTLRQEPSGSYDLLLIDAFSSDAIPTHMLTEEAIREYLRLLRPDGLLVLHLSNRNLEITSPAIAAAQALGVPYRHKLYGSDPAAPRMTESATEVLVLSPTPEGLAPFDIDPRWQGNIPTTTAPWTDDYVNLFGALIREARSG